MGVAGARPTPARLRSLRGAKNGTGPTADVIVADAVCPEYFDKERKQYWDRYIVPCFWLTVVDEPKAIMWCNLFKQYQSDPDGMSAPRIHQMRTLGSELGMDPTSRARARGIGGETEPKDNLHKYS